jgi:hypothetical protein
MTPPTAALETPHDAALTRNTHHYRTKAERPLTVPVKVVEAILAGELWLFHV